MKAYIEERVLTIAVYITETKCTQRAAAKEFGLSKSTVNVDMHKRLKEVSLELYREVTAISEANFEVKARRGGKSTQARYKGTKRGISSYEMSLK